MIGKLVQQALNNGQISPYPCQCKHHARKLQHTQLIAIWFCISLPKVALSWTGPLFTAYSIYVLEFKIKLTWKRGIAEGACPHESFWGYSVLGGHESLDCVWFISKHLHSNERLLAFLGEHVPRFGPGQKIADRALWQSQNALSE